MCIRDRPLFAQRQDILLNDNWKFRFSHQVQKGSEIRVDLPHTWNTQDALSGKIDYKRGIGNYEKKLFIRPEWQGKRLFLRFEGANSIADVFINRRHIGEHRGGYGAFVFEITGEVNYGKENSILVRVNNEMCIRDSLYTVDDFDADGKLKAGIPKVEGYNPNPGDILYKDLDDNDIINGGTSKMCIRDRFGCKAC